MRAHSPGEEPFVGERFLGGVSDADTYTDADTETEVRVGFSQS